MKEITAEELQTKRLKFHELPQEIYDYILSPEGIGTLLSTKGINQFSEGKMTIMDWKYKTDMIIDLLK